MTWIDGSIPHRIMSVLEQEPWLSSSELANKIMANPNSVAGQLGLFLRLGDVVRIDGLGKLGGYCWARAKDVDTPLAQGRRAGLMWLRNEALVKRREKAHARFLRNCKRDGVDVTTPDWREPYMTAEDYYAA